MENKEIKKEQNRLLDFKIRIEGKSKPIIYHELMKFINNCNSIETLKNMLVEEIDNNDFILLHKNYVESN